MDLEYNWRKIEHKFPDVYSGHNYPAIYTWVLVSKRGKKSYYLGQTDNLSNRIKYYMDPGPSQKTNIRINSEMRKSEEVKLYLLDLKTLKLNGKNLTSIALRDSDIRRGLEGLLIRELRIQKNGHTILNL